MSSRLQERIGDSLQILHVLGADGAEVLVCALDLERGHEAVLRLLVTDGALPPGALETFETEIARAERLEHPNIVPAGPLQRREGLVFAVVHQSTERTLESRLREPEPFTLEDSLHILRDVASALDHAHAHDVVHGSLVPALIFLRARGGARVAGFGQGSVLARWHRSESPAYAAPEQWHEQESADHRADLYALGVIAFELLTGRRRTTSSTTSGMITVDPLSLARDVPLRPGLGLNVNEAILRATSKRPASRFATAGEFVAMLEEQAATPVSGLPTQRPNLEVPRLRHIAALPLMLVLILGVTLGILAVPTTRHILQSSAFFSPISAWIRSHTGPSPASLASRSEEAAAEPAPVADGAASEGGSSSQSIFPGAATAGTGSSSGRDEQPVTAPAPATAGAALPVPGGDVPERAAGGEDAGSIAPPSDSSATGFLQVEFDGSAAVVMIDGIPRGTTPFLGRLRMGSHSVSLAGAHTLPPQSRDVHIGYGDTTLASFRSADSPRR